MTYKKYLLLLDQRIENYSNRQKTFWFTEIINNSLETIINIYVKSICSLYTFPVINTSEDIFKIKEKANNVIHLITIKDQNFESNLDKIFQIKTSSHNYEKYIELKKKILDIYLFFNSSCLSIFGSRGIGKTMFFQNTIINYSKKIIGISKENFDEIYSKEFFNSFFRKLKSKNIEILMIDSLNQTIHKEKDFNLFLKKILIVAKKLDLKIVTTTPLKLNEYGEINILFDKNISFFEFNNKLDNSEKEIIYKDCKDFDKQVIKFLISNLDDNPRSAILLKRSIDSMNKSSNQISKNLQKKDWSVIKYLRLITERYVLRKKSQTSRQAWKWLKENASLIFENKCIPNINDNLILDYLIEVNLIDVESNGIEMKDKLFFVLLFIYQNLNIKNFINSKENNYQFEKNIKQILNEKDFSLLILFSAIYIFEKWKRSNGESNIDKTINDLLKNYFKINYFAFSQIKTTIFKNGLLKNIADLMILDFLETNSNFYLKSQQILCENSWIINYANLEILLLVFNAADLNNNLQYVNLANNLINKFNFKIFQNSFFIYQNSKMNILIELTSTILDFKFLQNTPITNKFMFNIMKQFFFSFDKNMLLIIKSFFISQEIRNETEMLEKFLSLLSLEINDLVNSSLDNEGYKQASIYLYYSLLINIFEGIVSLPLELQKNFSRNRKEFILNEINKWAQKFDFEHYHSFLRIKKIILGGFKKTNFNNNFNNNEREYIKNNSIVNLNSYFFNKSVMNFLNDKYFTVYEYADYALKETKPILEKVRLSFLNFFPNEKTYKIDIYPKISYIYKPHSMSYKDWIVVMLLDKETMFDENNDQDVWINNFGEIILKDEIIYNNPHRYMPPILYDVLSDDYGFNKFVETTNLLIKNFKKNKRNLFCKSKKDNYYGIWYVLIKVTNKFGKNWNVLENVSGLDSFLPNEHWDKDELIYSSEGFTKESSILQEIHSEFFSSDVVFEFDKLNNSSDYNLSPGSWLATGKSYEWFQIPQHEYKWYKSLYKDEQLTCIIKECDVIIKSKVEVPNNIYCYFETPDGFFVRRWTGVKGNSKKNYYDSIQIMNEKIKEMNPSI